MNKTKKKNVILHDIMLEGMKELDPETFKYVIYTYADYFTQPNTVKQDPDGNLYFDAPPINLDHVPEDKKETVRNLVMAYKLLGAQDIVNHTKTSIRQSKNRRAGILKEKGDSVKPSFSDTMVTMVTNGTGMDTVTEMDIEKGIGLKTNSAVTCRIDDPTGNGEATDFSIVEAQIRKAFESESKNGIGGYAKGEGFCADINDAVNIFKKFHEKYLKAFGRYHPKMTDENIVKALQGIKKIKNMPPYYYYERVIPLYFEQKFNNCNYSILHFLSGDIVKNLNQRWERAHRNNKEEQERPKERKVVLYD